MTTLIAVPMAVGIAAVAPLLVPLVLGVRWLASIPVIAVLGLAAAVSSLGTGGMVVYLALGRPQLLVWLGGWYIAWLLGVPMCVLVRSTEDSRLGEDWKLNGVRLLDPDNWNLRMIDSMAGDSDLAQVVSAEARCFVVLAHSRRRVLYFNVTDILSAPGPPSRSWTRSRKTPRRPISSATATAPTVTRSSIE